MHLWGASERRLRAHHAHYKLSERLRWPGKSVADIDQMYSWSVYGPGEEWKRWTFALVPDWWRTYSDLMAHLDVDAEPWEEAECQKILAGNPGIDSGLDLFGVC